MSKSSTMEIRACASLSTLYPSRWGSLSSLEKETFHLK
jgi:hypothetical protein